MAGILTVTRGPEQGQERRVSGSLAVIGRGSGCEIVLTDDQVSRRHAELAEIGGRWFVSDLGSANGTFVNDRQLTAHDRVPLDAGDRLRLGEQTELTFDLEHRATAIPIGSVVEGAQKPSRSRAFIAGALLFLLAVIAAIGIWALLRNKSGDSARTGSQTSTPASAAATAGGAPAVVLGTKPSAGEPAPTATPLVQVKVGAGGSGPTAPAVPAPAGPSVQGTLPAQVPATAAAPVMAPPGAAGMAGLPPVLATAFPNAKGEQLAPLIQQALQSGQVKPEDAQQYIGALFPGVPVAQLPIALAGSFGGFTSQQIEQILNLIYPGQNIKLPEIGTGKGAVAFTIWDAERDQANIYLMNADGSGRQLLIAKASEPAFSSDGKRLAYFSWQEDALGIRIRDMDSGKDIQVTSSQDDLYPTWAPDGGRLAFWQFPNGIVTINVDGTNRRGISTGEFPAWSPSGDRIAMKGCVGNDCGIVLVNPDGSNPVRITTNANDGQPAWSPNGRDIAFVSNRDGNWEIYAVKADGSWLRRITNDVHTDGLPAWSSDGIRIAFRSDRDGTWAIYTATGIGGPPIKLVDAPVRTTGNWPWTVEKISWR